MRVSDRSVIRQVAVQHLRTAYGIKMKWNTKKDSYKSIATKSTKVFGVPLEGLPCSQMEYGSVPSFLVDACMKLQEHVDTEGLFRVSGSLAHLKTLQKKLDSGEECLSTARPCNLASLVKRFFRELPEPVLPTEMQEAFLKAQQLPTKEDRTSATMLLSCLLPERNLSVMRHFADFLQKVSKRSAKNKMDCSNLSLVLAPTLLHSVQGTEKMNGNTEKRLELETAVIHCFIENAHNFGKLPQMLEEKLSSVMGCEPAVPNEFEELNPNSRKKRRDRHGFIDKVKTAVTSIKAKRSHCYKYKPEKQTWFFGPKGLPFQPWCNSWTVPSQLPNAPIDSQIILLKHQMRNENDEVNSYWFR